MAEVVKLSPGDHFTVITAAGKPKRYTVKDDGGIQTRTNPVGFRAACSCDSCDDKGTT